MRQDRCTRGDRDGHRRRLCIKSMDRFGEPLIPFTKIRIRSYLVGVESKIQQVFADLVSLVIDVPIL